MGASFAAVLNVLKIPFRFFPSVSDKQSPKLDADRRRHVLEKEQRGGFGFIDRHHQAYATPRANRCSPRQGELSQKFSCAFPPMREDQRRRCLSSRRGNYYAVLIIL